MPHVSRPRSMDAVLDRQRQIDEIAARVAREEPEDVPIEIECPKPDRPIQTPRAKIRTRITRLREEIKRAAERTERLHAQLEIALAERERLPAMKKTWLQKNRSTS